MRLPTTHSTFKITAFPLFLGFSAAATLLCALPVEARTGSVKTFTVVIDPGHGGEDEGTSYGTGSRKILEKNVTLALAKRVAVELRARGMDVLLTRDGDREIALPARTALANRVHADLFLSIHMNSTSDGAGTSGAEGVETYILNNASDASSRRLASLENSVLSGYATGTPEETDVALILKDLRLDANLSESERLACEVQESLVSTTNRLVLPQEPQELQESQDSGTLPQSEPLAALDGSDASLRRLTLLRERKHKQWQRYRRDRGVRQALFHVLLGADMPSALVEAGFLSSARDRGIVLSANGSRAIGQAIARAIDRFRRARAEAAANSMPSAALSRCKVD